MYSFQHIKQTPISQPAASGHVTSDTVESVKRAASSSSAATSDSVSESETKDKQVQEETKETERDLESTLVRLL